MREPFHNKLATATSALLALTLQLSAPVLAQDAAAGDEALQPEEQDQTWLDASYEGIDSRAEDLAHWFDDFFGHARDVQDSPDSSVRIRPGYTWDEEDGSDWKLRVTGKLYLPKASDRLSVVFLGDQGGSDDDFYDPALASDGSGSAGIQYQVRDEIKSSAYLFAGVKAGLKAKLGARYQYLQPFLEVNRMRFSEEVFWIGGDGFGSLTRLDFDHLLNEEMLLRWANKGGNSRGLGGLGVEHPSLMDLQAERPGSPARVRLCQGGQRSENPAGARIRCGFSPSLPAGLAVLGTGTQLRLAQAPR